MGLLICLAGASAAGAQSIAELRVAAEQGDRNAARDLVDAYIDGSDEQPRDLKAASRELDSFREVLSENQAQLRRYLIYVGAVPASPEYFRQVATGFAAQAESQKRSALRRTLRLNRNAYVFVLERELAARGFHPWPTDSQLDKDTLSGILSFCASVSILKECQRGPMRRSVARVIANHLWPRDPD
ncbi:hypothetical protein EF888_19895 [Silicimonas algicola]|nr:hypothetical protein [Silicimonas algicola]AZQ69194.1 hypothetical protein EF888_19895 [Silicimonas algicola]